MRLLTLTLLLAGCSEYGIGGPVPVDDPIGPDILVDPTLLQFGELTSDAEEVLTFTVENLGQAVLTVDDLVLDDPSGAFSIRSDGRFALEPGELQSIDVAFTPAGSDNQGHILVLSDDPDTPEVRVDLIGAGAVPELQITPEVWTFDDRFVPCGDFKEVELANVGAEALVIEQVDYFAGDLLWLDDAELQAMLPLTLMPGETVTVDVVFDAVVAGEDTGLLAVKSTDPRGVLSAEQHAAGLYAATGSDSFTEPGVPPVDVMFLIDQSCSMEQDNVDDIQSGIPGFMTELEKHADWNLIQVTKADGCANGGILTDTSPNVESTLISNAFNSNHHSYTEALLQLAGIALTKTAPGQCNAGFLRPGALLHIIVASDEREQSGTSWSSWLSSYQTYVADPDMVRVSAIADIHKQCGDNSGAVGYTEIANATGGTVLDICNPSWGAGMTDIAANIGAGARTYELSADAHEASIEVRINGVVTTQWTYDPATQRVTVEEEVGEGDVVEIDYGLPVDCQ